MRKLAVLLFVFVSIFVSTRCSGAIGIEASPSHYIICTPDQERSPIPRRLVDGLAQHIQEVCTLENMEQMRNLIYGTSSAAESQEGRWLYAFARLFEVQENYWFWLSIVRDVKPTDKEYQIIACLLLYHLLTHCMDASSKVCSISPLVIEDGWSPSVRFNMAMYDRRSRESQPLYYYPGNESFVCVWSLIAQVNLLGVLARVIFSSFTSGPCGLSLSVFEACKGVTEDLCTQIKVSGPEYSEDTIARIGSLYLKALKYRHSAYKMAGSFNLP